MTFFAETTMKFLPRLLTSTFVVAKSLEVDHKFSLVVSQYRIKDIRGVAEVG